MNLRKLSVLVVLCTLSLPIRGALAKQPTPVRTNTPLPTAAPTQTALPTVAPTPTALPTQTPEQLTINNVYLTPSGAGFGKLDITGKNFGTAPAVTFDGSSLAVDLGGSSTEITTIDLPVPPAGSYALVVTNTQSNQSAVFEVAVGAIGPTGPNGTPGTNGTNGADGAPGTNGTNGADGAPGTNGTNGTDGAPGTNGTNGTDGAPGTNGEPGSAGRSLRVIDSSGTELGLVLTGVQPGLQAYAIRRDGSEWLAFPVVLGPTGVGLQLTNDFLYYLESDCSGPVYAQRRFVFGFAKVVFSNGHYPSLPLQDIFSKSRRSTSGASNCFILDPPMQVEVGLDQPFDFTVFHPPYSLDD